MSILEIKEGIFPLAFVFPVFLKEGSSKDLDWNVEDFISQTLEELHISLTGYFRLVVEGVDYVEEADED